MNIWTIILICVAIGGIWWAYPKLPWPANLILVIVVAFASIIVLLQLAGIETGLHF